MSEATIEIAIHGIADLLEGLTPFKALAALRIVGNGIVIEVLAKETEQLWEETKNE